MIPTVGVALGSGGAKGFAHIGVLKALEEANVPVHVVSGSSMGSLIGAFYATGMTPNFMDGLATTLKWRHWVDFTVPKMGMILGNRIRQMVALLTRNLPIEQAEKRLAIVATELIKKERIVFLSGSIADAVRASISIPGAFVPFVTADGVYVDGGVLDRVPVEAARDLGAEVVIAVDVAAARMNTPPESMLDVFFQSLDLMQERAYESVHSLADVTIVPEVGSIGTSQFSKAREAIEAGYIATKKNMDEILLHVFHTTDRKMDG